MMWYAYKNRLRMARVGQAVLAFVFGPKHAKPKVHDVTEG
jgi:hypothetical protein